MRGARQFRRKNVPQRGVVFVVDDSRAIRVVFDAVAGSKISLNAWRNAGKWCIRTGALGRERILRANCSRVDLGTGFEGALPRYGQFVVRQRMADGALVPISPYLVLIGQFWTIFSRTKESDGSCTYWADAQV